MNLLRDEVISQIRETGIMAVIRADQPSWDFVSVFNALKKGGVSLIEVTTTVPDPIGVIKESVAGKNKGTFIGAGTVLDAETARAVILAGAEFVVSPVYNPQVVELCRRYSVAVIPGAYTPTEVLNAWNGGADMVKVFPGVAGPKYIKDLKGPFPQIEMIQTGGVTLESIPEYVDAGLVAFGVGSSLVSKDLIARGDFKAITKNARDFSEAFLNARKK